jgi:hypothetical protein
MSDEPKAGSMLVIHASKVGLRIHTFNSMPISKRINMKISFPKGTEFESFRVESEIPWKDIYFWEDWEQYQYAVKLVEIVNETYLKLKRLLCGRSGLGEALF